MRVTSALTRQHRRDQLSYEKRQQLNGLEAARAAERYNQQQALAKAGLTPDVSPYRRGCAPEAILVADADGVYGAIIFFAGD